MSPWLLYVYMLFLFATSMLGEWRRDRQRRRAKRDLQTWLDETERNIIAGLQRGSYRGAKRVFGRWKNKGFIAATDKQLMFCKITGQRVAIRYEDIASVERRKRYMLEWHRRPRVVVITTRDGNEIGFMMDHDDIWEKKIRDHIPDRKDETHG